MILSATARKAMRTTTLPVLARIRRLEGIHSDEECYIFGDGVSVKYFDLDVFNDRVGLAVNAFPIHRDFHKTMTRYWMISEPWFFWTPLFKSNGKPMASLASRHRWLRPWRHHIAGVNKIINVTNFPLQYRRSTYYFFDKFPSRKTDKIRYEKSWFAGSIDSAISLAIYLGFRKATLVGFDYTHTPSMSGHWYELGQGSKTALGSEPYNFRFFSRALEHINLETLTLTRQKTFLSSIAYGDFCGRVPRFRENTELLNEEDMQCLALNPNYRIYE